MKKIAITLFSIILVMCAQNVVAQDRCNTMHHLQMQLQQDPKLALRMQSLEQQTQQFVANFQPNQNNRSVITIPVVVHVVYNTSAENISTAQIQSQIDRLNLDYHKLNTDWTSTPSVWQGLVADYGIQFCLASRDPNGNTTTGITRTQTSTTSFSDDDKVKHTAQGGFDAWPAASYLNLWVCDLGSSLLGYAQFPGGTAATDGVVINYTAFGTTGTVSAPYNLGRTATHEIGHWLNLYHIWGDDNGACSGSDQVNDTPNQADATGGCPSYPATDACATSSPGYMFMNYMDYTNDACMYMFTNGQYARSSALFATNGLRYSLTQSLGCSGTTTAPTASFTGTPTNICTGQSVQFTSTSTGTISTYSWTFTGGTPGSSTSQNPSVTYNTAGTYAVSLTVSGANGSNTSTQASYITVGGANTLPLVEGFEGTTFPPTGWTITNGDGATTWARTTSASGFGTSSASAYIDLYDYQTVGQQDWLITPAYNFTNVTNGRVKWDYAYAPIAQAGYYDTLTVYYSTNCGSTWTQIWKKGGTLLGTATATNNSFVPTGTQWKSDSVTLTTLNAQQNVKFAFVTTNKYGNNLFLDNVNLYSATTSTGTAPVANFVGSPTTVVVGNAVTFTDLSTNSPTSWTWAFTGAATTSSTQQNPTITYNTVGIYPVTLTATNASGNNSVTRQSYINVIQQGQGTQTCDTLSNFVSTDTLLVYSYNSPGWGYLAGHNYYGDLAKAEYYTNTGSATVSGALFYFAHAHTNTPATAHVTATVWDASGTGGAPGAILATQNVLISNIATDVTAQRATSVTFATPATVTGNFYIGFSFTYVAGDTVGLYTTTFHSPNPNGGWEQWSTGDWYEYVDPNAYGDYSPLGFDNAILPFVCTTTAGSAPVASFTSNNAAVCQGNTVTFTSTATGSPTSYSWQFPGGNPSISTDTNPTVTYSNAGSYNVSLTVSNGTGNNTTTPANYVTVYAKPGATTTSTAVACYGGSTGSATVTATGGTPGYTYNWSGGGTTTTISNKPSGTYVVTVTDTHQCSSTTSVNIAQPLSALTVSASAIDASCGLQNGSATVTPSGGAGNNTYSWNGGATTANISNLGSGTYNVTVHDNNQCSATAAVTVNASNTSFVVTLNVTNASCNQNNGVIAVAGFGTGTNTYHWSNGQTTGFISGLAQGSYSVTVTHPDGCSATGSGTVGNAGSGLTVSFSLTPAACSQANGSATATVTGGSGVYTYAWSSGSSTATVSGVVAGGYTLTVTDNAGCAATNVANISNAGGPSVSVSSTMPTCNSGANGTATATAAGGTPGYTYNWSNNQNGATASNLAAGVYVVSVHDNAQCVAVQTVTITQPAVLVANETATNATCGNPNGTATAAVTGGTGTYQYSWSNSSTGATISGLNPGPYSVVVYDANQCSASAIAYVGSFAGPVISVNPVNGTCQVSAGITLNVTGAINPVTYAWSNGANTQNIQNIAAGSYTVTVTDATNCSSSASASVTDNSSLTITFNTQSPTQGNANGVITANASGGNSPYSYTWSNNASTQTITNLADGSYTVTVTDNNGCIKVSNVTISAATGIAEVEGITSITIFPNPANEVCNIQIELNKATMLDLQMFNSIGQLVWSRNLTGYKQGTEVANVTGLSSGIYTVRAHVNGNVHTLKFVKQ